MPGVVALGLFLCLLVAWPGQIDALEAWPDQIDAPEAPEVSEDEDDGAWWG